MFAQANIMYRKIVIPFISVISMVESGIFLFERTHRRYWLSEVARH